MSLHENSQVAFILSLIGGILMLLGGGASSMWSMFGGLGLRGMMGGFNGMMWGYQGMMGSLGVPLGLMSGFFFIGLVSGILVTISAVMLNTRPSEHMVWGRIILVFSITSLLGMGGFFAGTILGIIGGALAMSRKPT